MKFSEYPYKRPDTDAVCAGLNDAGRQIREAKCFEEADAALLKMDALQSDYSTFSNIAHIRYTINTTDPFYCAEKTYFDETGPMVADCLAAFSRALLECPFCNELGAKYGEQLITLAKMQVKSMAPELIPYMQQENKLASEYEMLTASCKVIFDGKELNLSGLRALMASPDRETRKRAYAAWAGWFDDNEGKLGEIYDKLVHVRHDMGKVMGYDTFTPLAYLNMQRASYGPEEVARYREQVVEYIVPICTQLYKKQAKRLGLDKLCMYDEDIVFKTGNALPQGDMDELVKQAQAMYAELSPETGEFFNFMVEHELFDLVTKPGKANGGYCTYIDGYSSPFIFSNANGTEDDIGTLTHEAGHAFESYTANRSQKLNTFIWSTYEVSEIHSMSMEYFTLPWMERFFGAAADKYRYSHALSALYFIPYGCCVDEFQHEVYANPSLTPDERLALWKKLETKYLPDRDYDGAGVFERGGYWLRQLHIFMDPFYYIDYTLASLGAFEFYGRMLDDPAGSWGDYLRLCRAGGSLPYLDLLKLAHLSDPFEPGSVKRAAEPIMRTLNSMDDEALDR